MEHGFRYDIENMTPDQIKYAYERDITSVVQEMINVNNVLNNTEKYNIPESKIKELEELETSLELKLNNLRVEYNLAQV